jgi:hypothetical protein
MAISMYLVYINSASFQIYEIVHNPETKHSIAVWTALQEREN